MSALSDPNNVQLDDIEKTGDATEDPAWRELLGLDGKPDPEK